MEQRRYFRKHRGLFVDSMETMVEVKSVEDIKGILGKDFPAGYLRNIHIDCKGILEERCVPYGWGDTTYYVLADFDGYTSQCIGFANFTDGVPTETEDEKKDIGF